jgi:two-component system nitrogen regulation response regulator NtrX
VLLVDGLTALDAEGVSHLAQTLETGEFTRRIGAAWLELDVQVVVALPEQESALFDGVRAAVRRRGGIETRVPPLRERREDIPLLAQYTLQRLYRIGRTGARSFRGAALAALEVQPWPGNVRELIAAVEFAALRADTEGSSEIGVEHLPRLDSASPEIRAEGIDSLDFKVHLAKAELGLVESTIERFGTTKKEEIGARLHYNDRFAFSRRLRKILTTYPRLRSEFPRTAGLFPEAKTSRQRAEKRREMRH